MKVSYCFIFIFIFFQLFGRIFSISCGANQSPSITFNECRCNLGYVFYPETTSCVQEASLLFPADKYLEIKSKQKVADFFITSWVKYIYNNVDNFIVQKAGEYSWIRSGDQFKITVVYAGGTETYTSNSGVNLNQWISVAFAHSAKTSSVTIYLDGNVLLNQAISQSTVSMPQTSSYLQIGKNTGFIKDLAIFGSMQLKPAFLPTLMHYSMLRNLKFISWAGVSLRESQNSFFYTSGSAIERLAFPFTASWVIDNPFICDSQYDKYQNLGTPSCVEKPMMALQTKGNNGLSIDLSQWVNTVTQLTFSMYIKTDNVFPSASFISILYIDQCFMVELDDFATYYQVTFPSLVVPSSWFSLNPGQSTVNVWRHFNYMYKSGSRQQLYIDNVFQGDDTTSGITSISIKNTLYLGHWTGTDISHVGYLRDLSFIYDYINLNKYYSKINIPYFVHFKFDEQEGQYLMNIRQNSDLDLLYLNTADIEIVPITWQNQQCEITSSPDGTGECLGGSIKGCIVHNSPNCGICEIEYYRALASGMASCICMDGFYDLSDTAVCGACPTYCTKCTSGPVCTECKPTFSLVSGSCICTGGTSINALGQCAVICGDGLVASSESCDYDFSNPSNQGCSSDCTHIESGYTCSGGSTTSPSVCTCVPAVNTAVYDVPLESIILTFQTNVSPISDCLAFLDLSTLSLLGTLLGTGPTCLSSNNVVTISLGSSSTINPLLTTLSILPNALINNGATGTTPARTIAVSTPPPAYNNPSFTLSSASTTILGEEYFQNSITDLNLGYTPSAGFIKWVLTSTVPVDSGLTSACTTAENSQNVDLKKSLFQPCVAYTLTATVTNFLLLSTSKSISQIYENPSICPSSGNSDSNTINNTSGSFNLNYVFYFTLISSSVVYLYLIFFGLVYGIRKDLSETFKTDYIMQLKNTYDRLFLVSVSEGVSSLDYIQIDPIISNPN